MGIPALQDGHLTPCLGEIGPLEAGTGYYPIGLAHFDSDDPNVPSPMLWMRRIRKWRVQVSAIKYDGDPTAFDFDISNPLELREDSRNCILQQFTGTQIYREVDAFGPGDDYTLTCTASLGFGVSVNEPGQHTKPTCGYVAGGTLYYPRLRAHIRVDGSTPPDNEADNVALERDSDYSVMGTLDGQPMKFLCIGNVLPSGIIQSIAISRSATGGGFWPFADHAGNHPIWDKDTGELMPGMNPFTLF